MKGIGDISIELCSLYKEAMNNKVGVFEKGEKSKIFQEMIDYLFEKIKIYYTIL